MSFISVSNLKAILNDFKSKVLDKTLDKTTYASKVNDGSVKLADKALNLSESDDAQAFTYYGKNKNGEIGFHPFPIGVNDEVHNPQAVKFDVKSGDTISVDLLKENKDNDLIVQGYEFVEGARDVSTVLKAFNNTEQENFVYDTNNIDFTNGIHIKNVYSINSTKNTDTSFYETDIINKSEYLEILNIGR